jgi:hypothetical protein
VIERVFRAFWVYLAGIKNAGSMKHAFHFEYLDEQFAATAEVFFEGGLRKYRVAYDSHLIVIRELLHTIGGKGYTLFVQEVEPDEAALPAAFVQSIGFWMEDISFFPGSFVVYYINNSGQEQAVQMVKRGNEYKVVDCWPANINGLRLPVVLKKKSFLGMTRWEQAFGEAGQLDGKRLAKAITQHERVNNSW